jgi:hypothetical protein
MKKLLVLAAALSLSNYVFATGSIPLTGGTLPASGSLAISLSPLYAGVPYTVTCTITNPIYQTDQVVIGPQYSQKGVDVKYYLNGYQFQNLIKLMKQTNTFEAKGIQNVSGATSPNLTLVNIDTDSKASVNVSNCIAVPDIGIAQK